MATTTLTGKSTFSFSTRILIGLGALVVIFIISGLLLSVNYWWGVNFLFISLLFLTGLSLYEHEARNLIVLVILSLYVAVLVGSLAQNLLLTTPGINPTAQSSELAAFLTATLVGLLAAVGMVIVPFLILVTIATIGILQWHKKDEQISFWKAYRYLLVNVLGIFHFSVIVEGSEKKGTAEDLDRLDRFGGPGWLTVYPGQVVVLHEWGGITRVIGRGSTMLKRNEKIKMIVPLGGKGGTQDIDVLTRDRVPLEVTVLHVVQVEPAADTEKRLEGQLKEDDLKVGDDYDQCYTSIAKLVSMKASDVWGSMKGAVAGNIRDVFMTCNFDDLFKVSEGGSDLAGNINGRKIAEIEQYVMEKVKGSGPGKGVVLRAVDIAKIGFPKDITDKINAEITALMDARIKETEAKATETEAHYLANARVVQAKSEETAAGYQAKAKLELARAEADSERLLGSSRAGARAEYYRHILEVLREQPPEVISAVLQNLASSTALEDKLKHMLELTTHYVHGEHTGRAALNESSSKRD